MRLRFALPIPLVLAAVAVLSGCLDDAPRGNPLDPLSDNFQNAGAVAGTVTRFNPPYSGIRDAEVHLAPLTSGVELVARTGSDGRFSVPVPPGRYLLTASAPGFAPAADTVDVALGDLAEATLRLDGIPAVAQSMHTEHIERWYPVDPLYRLVVDATVSDPDGLGDIARVALVIPDLGFEDTLTVVVGGEPGAYTRTFEEAELPAALPALAGLPLHIDATDAAGVTGSAQDVQIVRIITSTPAAVAPVLGDTLTTLTPPLSWQAVGLSFAFTYRVQIVRVFPDIQVTVWTSPDLPSSQTQLQVPPGVLDAGGTYYWTVAVVDTFDNLSRSRENGFLVAP